MHLYQKEHENHLSGITRLVSMYQAISTEQINRFYPELPRDKLMLLVRRLEKNGRITFDPERELLLYTMDCTPDPSMMKALWVLTDFVDALTYHTISDFPVTLTFYTDSDAYEVIHVPPEKEMLMNHALSLKEGAEKRLVIVDSTEQIPLLTFPDIAAFCTVTDTGQVQYFKKQ